MEDLGRQKEELGKFITPTHAQPSNSSKDGITQGMILKTVCIYIGFTFLGLTQSVLGSSFADTERLLDTDTSHISAAFTANNVGYLAGSALCAFVYDRLSPEPQLAIALLVVALSTAVAPFYTKLTWFIAAMGIQGIGMAYIDSGTQAYCLSVWRGHRFQDAVIQGIFMAWSVGSSICPFILHPFLSSTDLAAVDSENSTTCHQQPIQYSSPDMLGILPNRSIKSNLLESGNVTSGSAMTDGNSVAYGYLIIGIILIPASCMYLINYAVSGKPSTTEKLEIHGNKDKPKRKSFLMVQMFFFFLVYVGLEVGFGGLLSLYVVRAFCFSNQRGALMTSLFWGSTGIGRLLGVPISMFLKPAHMLIGNISLIVIAMIVLATPIGSHSIFLWVSVISAGIGMSTIYPSAYLWCSRYMEITGVATAFFNVGGSVGSMVLPLATGILMDVYKPSAFVYSMSVLSSSLLALFILTYFYTKFCLTGTVQRTKNSELEAGL